MPAFNSTSSQPLTNFSTFGSAESLGMSGIGFQGFYFVLYYWIIHLLFIFVHYMFVFLFVYECYM
jgi:hypothetical protein